MGHSTGSFTFRDTSLPHGHEPRQLFVQKKYSNYKHEILHHLLYRQYAKCLNKAKLYMESEKVKSMEGSLSAEVWWHMGILTYPITTDHILSIILYCDMDRYSTRFSETFRKMYPHETMYSVRDRNSRYWWQSKFLKEAVIAYGICGRDEIMSFGNEKAEKGPFCL